VKKTITRFDSVAYSATFRTDSKLLVAGSEDGSVQIFDLASRAILRRLNGHKKAVRVSRFAGTDGTSVLSASDDTRYVFACFFCFFCLF